MKLVFMGIATAVVGLLFFGGGWVVVLAAAGTEVLLNTVFDSAVDFIGNKV